MRREEKRREEKRREEKRRGSILLAVLILSLVALLAAGTANIILVKTIKNSTNKLHFLYADQAAKSGIEVALTKIKHGTLTVPFSGLNGTINNCTYSVKGFWIDNSTSTFKVVSTAACPDGTIRTVTVEAQAGPAPVTGNWVPFYFDQDLTMSIDSDSEPLAGNGRIFVGGDLKVNDEHGDAAKDILKNYGFNPVDSAPRPDISSITFTNVTEIIEQTKNLMDYYHSQFPDVPEVNISEPTLPPFPNIEVNKPSISCSSSDTVCCSGDTVIVFNSTVELQGNCSLSGVPKSELTSAELQNVRTIYVDGSVNVTFQRVKDSGKYYLASVFLSIDNTTLNVVSSGNMTFSLPDPIEDSVTNNAREIALSFISDNRLILGGDWTLTGDNSLRYNLSFYADDTLTYSESDFPVFALPENSEMRLVADTIVAPAVSPAVILDLVKSTVKIKANNYTVSGGSETTSSAECGYIYLKKLDTSELYFRAENLVFDGNLPALLYGPNSDSEVERSTIYVSVDNASRTPDTVSLGGNNKNGILEFSPYYSQIFVDIKSADFTKRVDKVIEVYYDRIAYLNGGEKNLIVAKLGNVKNASTYINVSASDVTISADNVTSSGFIRVSDNASTNMDAGSILVAYAESSSPDSNATLNLKIDTLYLTNPPDVSMLSNLVGIYAGGYSRVNAKFQKFQIHSDSNRELAGGLDLETFSNSHASVHIDIDTYSLTGKARAGGEIEAKGSDDTVVTLKFGKFIVDTTNPHEDSKFIVLSKNPQVALSIDDCDIEVKGEEYRNFFLELEPWHTGRIWARVKDMNVGGEKDISGIKIGGYYFKGFTYLEVEDLKKKDGYDIGPVIEVNNYSYHNLERGKIFINLMNDAEVYKISSSTLRPLTFTIFVDGDLKFDSISGFQSSVGGADTEINLVVNGDIKPDYRAGGSVRFDNPFSVNLENSEVNLIAAGSMNSMRFGLTIDHECENCTFNVIAADDITAEYVSMSGGKPKGDFYIEGERVNISKIYGNYDCENSTIAVLAEKEIKFTEDAGSSNVALYYPPNTLLVSKGDFKFENGDNYYKHFIGATGGGKPKNPVVLIIGDDVEIESGYIYKRSYSNTDNIHLSIVAYDDAKIGNEYPFKIESEDSDNPIHVYGMTDQDLLNICNSAYGKAKEIACALYYSVNNGTSTNSTSNVTASSGIRLLKYIVK